MKVAEISEYPSLPPKHTVGFSRILIYGVRYVVAHNLLTQFS
jgi:hypothetical protein